MKLQPIRSCSCRHCKAGRPATKHALIRKVRRTAHRLNSLADPDDAQDSAVPIVSGGYTD